MRIEARDIAVRLGGATILDGVDIGISPGEFVGLIGPNGAGKTTLLTVLARLRMPDGGQLLYDDSPAGALGRTALARRLAYLAQGTQVDWPLAAEDVVALGRLPHAGRFGPADSAADRRAVEAAMAAADIAHFADRPVTTLSGGERMRVLLARALAVEAEILLADEPVAALDPYHQLKVMELLAGAARAGLGVVAVLHDLTLASRFCDRLVLLDGGRVKADGAPGEVLTDAEIGSAYGVASLFGAHDGTRYVLPWRRIDDRAAE